MISRLMAVLMAIVVFSMIGCGPTALQMQGEVAYYQAVAAITRSNNDSKTATMPLVRIQVADPSKPINVESIEVFAPPQPQNGPLLAQYQHRDYNEAGWRFLTAATGIIAPWVGVGVLAHEFGQMGNGAQTYYNNNVGAGATGNLRVQGNTSVTSSGSGTATATGMTDATSTPTVVKPEVVVVEQPQPVIVNQPEPIIVK